MRRLRRLGAIVAVLSSTRVLAGPLDDPHAVDTGFSGPTSGDLTSIYWNPAGLGLLQGAQAMVGGSWQSSSVSVDRASIDPATGKSPGATTFPSASGHGTLQPFRWPPGPAGFLGIGAGIGHRFGIALAFYSPFSTTLGMERAAGAEPSTRYHLVDMRFDHYAAAIGLGIHASESIQLGVAPGILIPSAHLVFDEDTALDQGRSPVEDPSAAARYDLASRGFLVPLYFLSLGAHYRHGRFAMGVSYTTAPLGTGGLVTLPMDRTRITPPGSTNALCNGLDDNLPDDCVSGQLRYRLPSIYTAGATWKTRGPWSVTAILRWLRYGAHQDITVLLSGRANEAALGTTVPDHVVLYRGFQDSFDTRLRLSHETKYLRVAGTLRLETSAVPASHVDAAAIDGLKLEPQIAAEMRVWRQIRVSATYAFAYMFPVDTGSSVFDPTAVSACAAVGGDLGHPACQARVQGRARPSAAGSYHLWRQTLGVYTSFGF